MNNLEFYKMEGAGNDFVVIDNRNAGLSIEEIIHITPQLCERRFGVGADGLLVLENNNDPEIDYTMIYRNADGSDAGMCGNGSRCLALFAAHHGFSNSHTFNVHDAVYKATVDKMDNLVSVSFPDVAAPKTLTIQKKKYLQVYTGTEHLVSFEPLDRLEQEDELTEEGSIIRNHPILNPPGTNVNFASLEDDETIYLQTYERGVEGLTFACGTGAMATAIAVHAHTEGSDEHLSYPVTVKGGTLEVSFRFNRDKNLYTNLQLTGPAHFVFQGSINI